MEANLEAQEHEELLPSKNEIASKLIDDSTCTPSFPPEDMSFTINVGKRPHRDVIFKFLFLGTILLTYGIGIVAFTRADFTKLQHSKFNPATNECEELGGTSRATDDNTDHGMILKLMAIVSLSVLVMTFPVGLFFLWLLQRYMRGLVLAMVPLLCLVLLSTSIYRLICVNTVSASAEPISTQILNIGYLLGISALLAYQIWKMRSRNFFEIDFELITMATKALKDNFWILVLNRVMLLGSMVLVDGPIFTFIWYAVNNGQIVPNFDVVNDPSLKGSCDNGTGSPCCQQQSPAWVSAYVALAFFTTFWVLVVTIRLQVLVVSGTMADWYFSSTGSSGNIKRSLRNAFGPSLGTACHLGMMIPTIVVEILGLVKKATNRVLNSSSRQGIILSIVRGCVSWMSEVPECNPRFASNFAAISGDSFWLSSKKANHLLQRNSLATTRSFSFMVHYVFTCMTAIYWILQSLLVFIALEYFIDLESLTAIMISMVFCIPVTMLGLGQFGQAVATVMDTVYICYAMEKDVGEISKPEVCHAYTLVRKWGNAPPETDGSMLAPVDKVNAL